MHHKAVECQRVTVKSALLTVEILHHFHHAVNQAGDVIHFAHAGVQFRIDDMKRNEGGFIRVQCYAASLADLFKALLTQLVLSGIIAQNTARQRILEFNPLLFAPDCKADMVRQCDQQ